VLLHLDDRIRADEQMTPVGVWLDKGYLRLFPFVLFLKQLFFP
jgi:hypothetical protein